jgi:hypothetical protein
MKKNLVKLGALALAVTLALVFAACAQPTDESAGGAGTPTIIRLYLDRQALPAIAAAGADKLLFTVGTLDEDLLADTTVSTGTSRFRWVNSSVNSHTLDRYNTDMDDPETLFLKSQDTELKAVYTATGSVVGNVAVNVEDGKGYYVDIELVDMTYDSIDQGKVFAGSDSFYISCKVTSGGIGPNGAGPGVYYYTPDHTSFHSDPTSGNETYDRIETVDLSPGVNELHFKYFTYAYP